MRYLVDGRDVRDLEQHRVALFPDRQTADAAAAMLNDRTVRSDEYVWSYRV